MLPEVGSTIVPPGCSAPLFSAASIMRTAMRSFTEPPGLRYSTLASTSDEVAADGAPEPDQRGVADQLQQGIHVLHGDQPTGAPTRRRHPRLRRIEPWGRPPPRAGWPPPRRTAAAGSACSAAPSTACCGPRPSSPGTPSARPRDRVPDPSGWYGRGRPAPPIKLAVLGDSSAAGYGRRQRRARPPARWLGSGVAERADRRVHLAQYAVVGAQSSDLDGPGRARPCRWRPTSR